MHTKLGQEYSLNSSTSNRNLTSARISNLTYVSHSVSLAERESRQNHRGVVLWLTGLSGSGKSTLAMALERKFFDSKHNVFVLDGDNIRHGLNSDLGFSNINRHENIRRVGEVAALFARAGFICITSFISPFSEDRLRARRAALDTLFFEVYVKADLKTCERRDPKGLYKKAREGLIPEMTGIDSPYEVPKSADLIVDSALHSPDDCTTEIFEFVVNKIIL